MGNIPDFDDAEYQLKDFLTRHQLPSSITWIRPEDSYSTAPDRHVVVWPSPQGRTEARRRFDIGREQGLVGLDALFQVTDQNVVDRTVATVITPRPDQIQGWPRGLKLSIRRPFVQAEVVLPGLPWLLHRLRPAYRRFQRASPF